MLSFQLSAIDLVLVIAVVVLFILYLKKFSISFPEEKHFRKLAAQEVAKQELVSQESSQEKTKKNFRADGTKCPRGYGNIRKLNSNNSISDRCLGCYNIVECYSVDLDKF